MSTTPQCGRNGTTSAALSERGAQVPQQWAHSRDMQRGPHEREPAVAPRGAAQTDEVVAGVRDGVADQIVHGVADLAQRRCAGYSTGRAESEHHSDHDPGYSAAVRPTDAKAATVTVAVIPEPQ